MEPDWQRISQEAERVHTRYVVEVVEAFGLCPWAKEARTHGRVHMHVTRVTTADPQALLAEVDICMRDASTEVGMLICPMLALSRTSFRHLIAEVRSLEQRRHPRGEQHIAIADFHPNAPRDLTSPERLVPFLRRSPDPMLQIIRVDALARVRRSQEQGTSYVDPAKVALLALDQLPAPEPSLAARVAQANLRTVQRVGVSQIAATISSIHEDRNRAYAAIDTNIPAYAHNSDTLLETDSASTGNSDEKPESKAG